MSDPEKQHIEKHEQKILDNLAARRIILPILLGVCVIAFQIWRQFDPKEFAEIPLNSRTLFWIGVAIILLIIRHLSYSFRLRLLSNNFFSWLKSIELIFIWEFSSAVSPTSLGGSAVALFMLAQEKLSAARTTALVIYTVILDTFFFLLLVPTMFLVFGPRVIRPDMESLFDQTGWGITFLVVIGLMLLYGSFFFYGLIVNARPLRNFLVILSRISFLKKYKPKIIGLGNDLVIASRDMKTRDWHVPLFSFLATATAWSCRFLIINALVLAFVETTSFNIIEQLLLYSRSGTMFMIMAFSPTPGGSGFAEIVFGGFLSDYIPKGIAPIIASIWRLLTYYFYIFAGLIVIPNWIRKLISRRIAAKRHDEEESEE